MPLKLGMFLTPASNPQRPMSEVIDWNIDVIRMAEQYGYDEVWVGSHLTSHYSRIACPIQVIARAIGETSNIMLGTGVTVLYQNHPLTIAAQSAPRGRTRLPGADVEDVAAELGLNEHTGGKWHRRFLKIAAMGWLMRLARADLELLP